MSKTLLWKSVEAVQFFVDPTGPGYNLFINWCFKSKEGSLRFLSAMIAEWAEYLLIWSRLSHGMNHVRHAHEPAERMFLLSMKLAILSLTRV